MSIHNKNHASEHLTGADDAIQLATNAQPGIVSAAQILALEANSSKLSGS